MPTFRPPHLAACILMAVPLSCTDVGGDDMDTDCEDVSATDLASVLTSEAPTVDGDADESAWDGCLPTLEVGLTADLVYTPSGAPMEPSYPGYEETTATIRSVYTDSDVYFLVTWDDPTKSLERYPWVKQADGSWKNLKNKDSSGHENVYYEDKFAFQWDVNNDKFEAAGCYNSCHLVSDPSDENFPGKKYNGAEGVITDMWHWKSVRTNPNNQLDDKYLVGLLEMGNGRTADSKDGGGYKDNINDDGNKAFGDDDCPSAPFNEDPALQMPCFMGPPGEELVKDDKYWILDSEKQDFSDSFAEGDVIAGMITSPFEGGRGDAEAYGEWVDGVWTLEIRRSLTTDMGAAEDVQFDDLSKIYDFGVASFDNTQINHAAHAGTLHFMFED